MNYLPIICYPSNHAIISYYIITRQNSYPFITWFFHKNFTMGKAIGIRFLIAR